MGITSARITSITRACDYYNRARVAVRFGSQARGREGWTINNPKAKIVRRMLQLLQQRAGSGPLLASLKMPVWEPYPRIFRMGQPNDAAAEAQKPSALPTSEQMKPSALPTSEQMNSVRGVHERYAGLVEMFEIDENTASRQRDLQDSSMESEQSLQQWSRL